MRTHAEPTAQVHVQPASSQLLRCGGVQCPPGTCDHDGEQEVQRWGAGPAPAAVPTSVRQVLGGSGSPLGDAVRAPMEARFGHSFADVRVHTDEAAARSAEAIQAHAYTFGRHVVMGAGRWQPHTPAGQKLLAHELTHVVQQAGSNSSPSQATSISNPHDPAEHEAAHLADHAGDISRPAMIPSGPQVALARIDNPLFPCHEVSGSMLPGSRQYFGTDVHLAIQQHYVSNIDGMAATEYVIPGSSLSGATGRADIVDSTGGVYEIKPSGQAAEAFEEARNYVLTAEQVCDPAVNWHLGRRYWPPSWSMAISGEQIVSWLEGPGVILYFRRRMPPVPVPVDVKERKTNPTQDEQKEKQQQIVPEPVTATREATRTQQEQEPASDLREKIRRWLIDFGIPAAAVGLVVGMVIAALADPEPVTKVGLIVGTAAAIALLVFLGRVRDPGQAGRLAANAEAEPTGRAEEGTA